MTFKERHEEVVAYYMREWKRVPIVAPDFEMWLESTLKNADLRVYCLEKRNDGVIFP